MSTKSKGYVTFIVHCPECRQRLSPIESDGPTTTYQHENPSDCSGEGEDIELPTVTVDEMVKVFSSTKKASKKKAKK